MYILYIGLNAKQVMQTVFYSICLIIERTLKENIFYFVELDEVL